MVALVDLDEVKARLNFDTDLDDDDLELLISAASEIALNYLNLAHDAYDDTNGKPQGVPEAVRTAVIMLVGILKRDPSAIEAEKWQQGYLPAPVVAILYPLRDPALA